MKNIIRILVLTFVTFQFSHAQTSQLWVELQTSYGAETSFASPMMHGFTFHSYKNGFGVSAYGQAMPQWGQFLAGPTYGNMAGKLYLQGGVSGGVEVAQTTWRSSAFLYGQHPSFWFLGIGEYGATSYYYQFTVESKRFSGVAAGIHGQLYGAHGLRISYQHSKVPILAWIVPGWDFTGKQIIYTFGVRYTAPVLK